MEKLRAGRANIYFVIKKKPETAYKFQNGVIVLGSFAKESGDHLDWGVQPWLGE
jgi:hypothetical protein